MDDPFRLDRFVQAQDGGVFETALAELEAGAKRSHWMWFIFPQHRDLGRSAAARFYGLTGKEEAFAYANHPVLGPRLRRCAAAILGHLERVSAESVLGSVDAQKLCSSMQVFAEVVQNEPLFGHVFNAANCPGCLEMGGKA